MSAKPHPSPALQPAAAPLGTLTLSQPEKRKRGAQLRNRNALKHGFYAQKAHAHLDLASIGTLDYEDILKTLCLITRTAVCIKRLQRIKRIFRIAVKLDALFAPFRTMLVFLKIFICRLHKPGKKKTSHQ